MSLEIILSLFEEIIESIDLIEERFKEIKTPHDFIKDQNGSTILDAIAMRLQVIGEATKKIKQRDEKLLLRYPGIERNKISRRRDFISHHYSELDEVEVFTACKFDIPELRKVVDLIIGDINNLGIN